MEKWEKPIDKNTIKWRNERVSGIKYWEMKQIIRLGKDRSRTMNRNIET